MPLNAPLHGALLLGVAPVLLAAGAGPARADAPATVAAPAPDAAPDAGTEMEFEADAIAYDEKADRVTATGNVVVHRNGETLTADTVIYDRTNGTVTASGNVLADLGDGTRAVADGFELSDSLRDGVIENVLMILSDGSRLAANRAVRKDGRTILSGAIYSPCAVIDPKSGCPIHPVWDIKASRVVHDPAKGRVRYRHPRLELWGIPIAALPGLSHPDRFDHSYSGLLTPNIGYSRERGGELVVPWMWAISPDQDLTLTGHIFTSVNPVLEVEYRHLLKGGPIRFAGQITYAGKQIIDPLTNNITTTDSRVRGYFEGNGEIAHGNGWRSRFSTRLTTDNTFPGFYGISLDTRLRSTYALEHFADGQYFSVEGWAFQGLKPTDSSKTTPIALPLVDFYWRLPEEPLGGRLVVEANSLMLFRREGQSVARALASVRWDRAFLTPAGQRVTFTALARSDLYHTDDGELETANYRGADGWHVRAIPLAAVDVEWPMAGRLFGGTQTLTPRVQMVVSTTSSNDDIPNEDSRAIDLEDSNLFSLNRFSGYDRWEGGARITYGADWLWRRPGWEIRGQIGQSYRFDNDTALFPQGTGLSGHFSDFVGRVSVRAGNWVEFVQRLRLDKDSFAIRRAETDIQVGSRKTYFTIGYSRYDRGLELEDLRNHEELRAGTRVAIGRYWAIFGSTVVDLTTRREDPTLDSDGWRPIRHRLGVSYRDECFDFSLAWRRNYVDNPNQRRGNTFLLTLALRNLG